MVEGTERLDTILRDGQVIAANVREFSGEGTQALEEILYESRLVVGDARSIVRNVRDIVGQSSGEVQAGIGSLSGTLIRLQSTLDSLNYSLQNVQDITDKVNEGEGTLGALVNDPSIAEKADSILGDTQEVTSTIGRLRTIIQLRSEYHLRAEQFKNVLGLRLQPRKNKYYLIEIVDDYRGVPTTKTETIINEDPGAADRVNVVTTRTVEDTFRVSLQFAQGIELFDWLAVTGRFGLIEGTGGLGMNVDLFEDRSAFIQADLFDFSFADQPRLRIFADYNVAPYIHLIAGVDDVLNDNDPAVSQYAGINPFVGLGIYFTDEDLKGLIATTGVPASP